VTVPFLSRTVPVLSILPAFHPFLSDTVDPRPSLPWESTARSNSVDSLLPEPATGGKCVPEAFPAAGGEDAFP
jgi:hypothetical protein